MSLDGLGRVRRWWLTPSFSRFTALWMGVLAFAAGWWLSRG